MVPPSNLGRVEVEVLAREFLKLHGLAESSLVNPHGIAVALGGRIEQVPGCDFDTSLEVRGAGDFTVRISSLTSYNQDRRTIGHELGHYILHSKCGELPMSFPRFGKGRAEWEANWFWMALLGENPLRKWPGEVCKRCGRRNCVGFSVPDETWTAVVRGRWNVICPTCFDEEAEAAGIKYRFGEVWPVSWSDYADV